MISSKNPFDVLSNKKATRQAPPKTKPKKEGKDKEKPTKIENSTSKPAASTPAVHKAPEAAPTSRQVKDANDKTDRRDRTTRGHDSRKGGAGKGGWTDNRQELLSPVEQDHGGDSPPPQSPGAPESPRADEPAEPQTMTYDDYLAAQKDKKAGIAGVKQRAVRAVDTNNSAGLAVFKKTEDVDGNDFGLAAKNKPQAKKAATDKPKKDKKADLQGLLNFRPPQRDDDRGGRGGRGRGDRGGFRGRGRGRGEGRGDGDAYEAGDNIEEGGRGGRGGRGPFRGRGTGGFRGGRGGGRGAQPRAAEQNVPSISDESAFPALGTS